MDSDLSLPANRYFSRQRRARRDVKIKAIPIGQFEGPIFRLDVTDGRVGERHASGGIVEGGSKAMPP